MELGLTIPLQRFLKIKPPAYGTEPDRRFCWDLHGIFLRGHSCLLAVHCHSRYTFVCCGVTASQWSDLPTLFREGLCESLTAAGFSPAQISAYLQAAGLLTATRTHGPPGSCFSQPGMGRCGSAGHLPGRHCPVPTAAGARGQHASQPLCGAGRAGAGPGTDGFPFGAVLKHTQDIGIVVISP